MSASTISCGPDFVMIEPSIFWKRFIFELAEWRASKCAPRCASDDGLFKTRVHEENEKDWLTLQDERTQNSVSIFRPDCCKTVKLFCIRAHQRRYLQVNRYMADERKYKYWRQRRLDSNKLTDSWQAFVNLRFLLMLNISSNRINTFDYAQSLLGLSWLDLHSNRIDRLSNSFYFPAEIFC